MRLEAKPDGTKPTEVGLPTPARDGLGAALRAAFRLDRAVPDELDARLDKIQPKGSRGGRAG